MEELASGYGLLEAPCVDDQGRVWFSDVMGGGVHRWSPGGEVELVLPKRRGIGGMALHAEGGVIVSGRNLVHFREGESRTVLELEGVTGFNDLATAPDGSVYVGSLRWLPFGDEKPVPGEVWRAGRDGSHELVFEGIEWANGIGLSPDGAALYVADYATGRVLAHEAGETRVFAESPSGHADGLAVDGEGGSGSRWGRAAASAASTRTALCAR